MVVWYGTSIYGLQKIWICKKKSLGSSVPVKLFIHISSMIVFRYRGKIVAIKRYKHNQRRLTISDMFCREISMIAIVLHPNVIKFMGACKRATSPS